MDAQHSRKHGCHQHLQWHGNPADKQPHGNPPGYRPTIQVPYHGLREGIAYPAPQPCLFAFAPTQQLVQFKMHRFCVGQFVPEPVCGHCQKTGEADTEGFLSLSTLNVRQAHLLSFSTSTCETGDNLSFTAIGKSC